MRRAAVVATSTLLIGLVLVASLGWGLSAPRLDVPDREAWTFRNVTLVEAGRPARTGMTLRIADGRIAEITRATSDASSPSTGTRTDFAVDGLFVAPGLSDLHVHYPPRIVVGNTELWSLLLLAHGVTSIRETGSVDGGIFDVREAIRDGRFPGPRIFACGTMLDGTDPSFPSNRVVATAEEASQAVEDLARQGADCIKAYNMLSPEALGAITRTAARLGLPVIGHAPHSVPYDESGIADLQHGTGAVIVDLERVRRQDFRAADWTSVDAGRIAEVARVSIELGIAHTPTLVNARMRRLLGDDRKAERAMEEDSGLRHLPRFWMKGWSSIWGAPFRVDDMERGAEDEAIHEFFRARQAAMTVGFHEAGVRIHAGTDTLMPFVAPGSSLLGELDELVAAGIAHDDVWSIATREAGYALGSPGLGTLEVGSPADLVFLRSDPTGDVSAFREIEAVLADGRFYTRDDLDSMLERFDAHFRGAFYSTAMGFVVGFASDSFTPDEEASLHDASRQDGERT